jgi:Tol biopolymer transport system component
LIGQTLLHYDITGKLGEGGMGEVYRGTDTRLGRDVAVKVLPEAFTQDAERLARFEREAQVLAALNHQRIASIYGLEQSEDQKFLVLELVEGPTLSERMDGGPVSVEQAIEIGLQMAEGLEAAHEAGIVHRDLKPANVKLTSDGQVKILDFGLAKAWESESGDSNLTQSPTLTAQMTQAGVILGTASYMSPEQARAQEADKRSDVWSFGVILWEMLTGRRLFEGATVSDILASVLKEAPDLDALPGQTPAQLRTLLARCLERDPRLRLRDIGEARIALSQPMAEGGGEDAPAASRRSVGWLWAAAGLLLGVLLKTFLGGVDAPAEAEATRVSISVTPATRLDLGSVFARDTIAIRPDGRQIAFAGLDQDGRDGVRQLWIRDLADPQARVIPDSEGGSSPFYSPDGQWLGFVVGGEVLRVVPSGGGVQPLPKPPGTRVSTAAWAADGGVVAGGFNQEDGTFLFWKVDPESGEIATLKQFEASAGDSTMSRRWVQPLADQSGLLYCAVDSSAPDGANLIFLDLESGAESTVQMGALRPRLLSTGEVLYSNEGRLYMAPFDPETGGFSSPPRVVLDGLAASPIAGNSWYEASSNGTLISIPAEEIRGEINSMLRVGPGGGAQAVEGQARYFVDPRLSPDGGRLAFSIPQSGNDIWVHDFSRNTQTRLSSAPGEDETPVWSPSGDWLAWASAGEGRERGLVRRRPDGSGTIETLWTSERHFHVSDWSPDGEFILLDVAGNGFDIWQLPLDDPEAVRPLLEESHNELHSRLSPDGRWLSYTSNETGRDEVYLQSFPALDRKIQVSADGGHQGLWAPNGGTLFFRSQAGVWAVTIEGDLLSSPTLLFPRKYAFGKGYGHFGYDAAPDGTFLMSASDTSFLPRRLDLFIGWGRTLSR